MLERTGYRTIVSLTVLLGLLLNSCAGSQGFDRHAMQSLLQQRGPRSQEPAVNAPALAAPSRLALFFVRKEFPPRHTMRKADWLSADKQTIMDALAPLREERILSDLFLLEDTTIRGHDAPAIRQAGRRYGADAVLIIDGIGAVDRYNNRSSWLYATLAGTYLASGTHSDALFMIDGSLWDVPMDRLHATQLSEGASQSIGPAMSVDDEAVLRQAKKAALKEFGKRMADQLRRLSGEARPSHDRSR